MSKVPRLGWFHRYPARFAAEVVVEMLAEIERRLDRKPNLLADPFAGTGATLAVCRQLGLDSVGVELSPLGVLVAELRLAPPSDPAAARARAEHWAEASPPAKTEVSNELAGWLGDDNARAVSGYLRRLRATRDERLRRFLAVAVSSSLRPASRWLPGSIKPQIDPERVPPAIGPQLQRAARQLAADCRTESVESEANARIVLGSARALPLPDASVEAIVTSPPYFVTYDYLDVHRLTFLAFGWSRGSGEQIGRRYYISPDGVGFTPPTMMEPWYRDVYRGEDTVLGRALRAYLRDMRAHLDEAARVLAPGGVVAYAIGNSVRACQTFDLAGALAELFKEAAFESVEVQGRAQSSRRILPAGRDAKTGRFSSKPTRGVDEYVIYAQRSR